MKKISFLFLALLLTEICFAQTYQKDKVTFLSNWFDPTIPPEPVYGIKYNGIWGWYDSTKNREYAIIGSGPGTYFIDVTNPTTPVVVDYVPGKRDLCIWREIKTYKNYCYMVSDDSPPNSLQIADMSYLPDSVHIVHDSNTIIETSHTIYIDGDKLYCGSVAGPSVGGYSGLAVFSLTNPELPTLIRRVEDDLTAFSYAHDMLTRNDTIYAFCANDGLFVLKLQAANTFSLLGSLTSYPDQGYNHSGAISPDGNTLVFCDEVPENLAVKVCDVSDLSDIQVKNTFKSNEGATPHNPFMLGNYVVISYYQDGVQIYDVSNPVFPVRTGFFDTFYQNDGLGYLWPPYQGSWGAYVDLPSGIIVASDMQNGLFVLDISAAMSIDNKETGNGTNTIRIYPNPFSDEIHLTINSSSTESATISLHDILGRKILEKKKQLRTGNNLIQIPVSENLSAGVYILTVQTSKFNFTQKLIK